MNDNDPFEEFNLDEFVPENILRDDTPHTERLMISDICLSVQRYKLLTDAGKLMNILAAIAGMVLIRRTGEEERMMWKITSYPTLIMLLIAYFVGRAGGAAALTDHEK